MQGPPGQQRSGYSAIGVSNSSSSASLNLSPAAVAIPDAEMNGNVETTTTSISALNFESNSLHDLSPIFHSDSSVAVPDLSWVSAAGDGVADDPCRAFVCAFR